MWIGEGGPESIRFPDHPVPWRLNSHENCVLRWGENEEFARLWLSMFPHDRNGARKLD